MRGARPGRGGFTLLETMIAAILLLIMFFALAQIHARGRAQMALDEHRRKATAELQATLEGLRRDYDYDSLGALDGDRAAVRVDGMDFTVATDVSVGTPEAQATTVVVTVSWHETIGGNDIVRDVSATTILARGLTWQQ